jgi:hypothetical protein
MGGRSEALPGSVACRLGANLPSPPLAAALSSQEVEDEEDEEDGDGEGEGAPDYENV